MSQQYNESQGYNADLQGATSTDAEQQSLVEQPVVIDEDLPPGRRGHRRGGR